VSTQERAGAATRWHTLFAAVRDLGTTGLALWGVWHQEHTGVERPWLLLLYVVVLGIIPASHAWALVRSAVPGDRTEPSPSDTAPAPPSRVV